MNKVERTSCFNEVAPKRKRRRKKYIPRSFESAVERSSEVFASLHNSLLSSPAWKTLTNNQKVLYIYCKLQYYGETPRGEPQFTMNQAKWCKRYGLYSEGNGKGFYRDMNALIEHGFIDCIFPGRIARKKNRYKLSDRWRTYSNKDYTVPITVMTAGMAIKHATYNKQ